MALITMSYRSDLLKRNIVFRAYLPVDRPTEEGLAYKKEGTEKFRTLYLLHGLTNNQDDWINSSRIERIARNHNLAVIFPNGENSFYVNGLGPNSDFGRLIGQELVDFTRKVFPLSDKREDTFIGGVSMGGFGAIRNGLKYADTFSRIISFSAAIHLLEFEPGDPRRQLVCNEDQVMGPYREAVKSDKNPAVCLHQLQEKVEQGRTSYPQMYMICGLQDSLIDANRSFHEKLVKAGVPVIYREYPGKHEFEFWNQHVETMITWLMEEN